MTSNKKARKNKLQRLRKLEKRANDGNSNNGEDSLYDDGGEYQDDAHSIELDENGFIPNGFTIDFTLPDGDASFGGRSKRKKRKLRNGGAALDEDNDDDDDADSDEELSLRGGLGSQVLPVALELPEDHDGNPLDGHEYLLLVRREAAAHPGVVVADAYFAQQKLLVQGEAGSTSKTVVVAEIAPSPGPSHRPSVEWRTAFLARFTNMREVYAQAAEPDPEYAIPKAYLPLPPAADESSWNSYINGRKRSKGSSADKQARVTPLSVKGKERASDDAADSRAGQGPAASADGVPSEGADMDISDDEGHDAGQAKVPGATLVEESDALDPVWLRKPRPPIPALLRSLDQQTTLSLLAHFATWLGARLDAFSDDASVPSTQFLPPVMRRLKAKAKATGAALPAAAALPERPLPPAMLTPLDSQWLFSLLAVLNEFLASFDISTLRDLARICLEIADVTHSMLVKYSKRTSEQARAVLEQYRESIAGCWMVVSVVYEVWKQRDLWDGM